MELPIALGQVIANKYRVDRVIGAGGMGVVLAGFHLELEQPVAIKFLSAGKGLEHEAAVRFRREAQAAAKIHSEHVVRVYDVGLFQDAHPYLIMELLLGNDLEKELESRGPLPIPEATSYLLQAIDAIAEAHAVGIIHRDLKPTNLYLTTRTDGTRLLKVLDFGISKSIVSQPRDVALTRTAAFVGSPLYMSPEQMRSARDVDSRTDIWALGTILYVLLTAQLPFTGESLPELCMAVLNDPPRTLREFLPAAPQELERILQKCLSRDRTQRYATVAELAADLVQFLPEMRPYASRAQRLLTRTSESSASSLSVPVFSAGVPHLERISSVQSGLPEGTQSSWDKSSRRTSIQKRLPVLLGLVGGGLLLSALLLWRSENGNRGESPNAVLPAQASQPKEVMSGADTGLIRPREKAAELEPVTSARVTAEPVSAPPSAAPSVRAVAPALPAPNKPRAAPKSVPAGNATKSRETAGSAPGAPSEIPYYGGRR